MNLLKPAFALLLFALIAIHTALARQEDQALPTAKKFISYSRDGLVDSALAMLTPECRKKAAQKMPYFLTFAHSANLDSLRLLDTRWLATVNHSETQMLFDAPRDTGWVLFTVNMLKNRRHL